MFPRVSSDPLSVELNVGLILNLVTVNHWGTLKTTSAQVAAQSKSETQVSQKIPESVIFKSAQAITKCNHGEKYRFNKSAPLNVIYLIFLYNSVLIHYHYFHFVEICKYIHTETYLCTHTVYTDSKVMAMKIFTLFYVRKLSPNQSAGLMTESDLLLT